MSEIPRVLHCITLRYIIDDANALEGYLSEHPGIEDCIPVVIRDVFFQTNNCGLQAIDKLPDAKTTLEYLEALLTDMSPDERLEHAVKNNLSYMVAYLISRYEVPVRILTFNLVEAARYGNTDVIRVLRQAGAGLAYEHTGTYSRVHSVSALMTAARYRHTDTVLYLLKLLNDDSDFIDDIITLAAEDGNQEMLERVLQQYPKHKLDNIDFTALTYDTRAPSVIRWLEEEADRREAM